MAVTVADTSPLPYLFQIGHLELLERLFGTVLVPEAVRDELQVGRSLGFDVPDPVRFSWMLIRPAPTIPAVELPALGPGESAALALALETPDSLVLLDDAAARAAAARLGLPTTGTLGLLLIAKEQQLIAEVAPVIAILEERGFRLTEAVRQRILRLAAE